MDNVGHSCRGRILLAALLTALALSCLVLLAAPRAWADESSGASASAQPAAQPEAADASAGLPASPSASDAPVASGVREEPDAASATLPAGDSQPSADDADDRGSAASGSASGAVAEPSGASVSGTAADADSAESAAAEEPAVASVAADSAQGTSSDVNLYRLYNPNSGEHFYTSSLAEAGSVATAGWRWEGVGWVEPAASSAPVWRLYNPNAGDHHYTLSAYERDWLVSLGWRAEGTGWYSAGSSDGAPVWRLYNPNAVAGAHHYTLSASERDWLVSLGWRSEGVGFYASSSATLPVEPFWLVTAAWGSLERYWVQSDGSVAVSRLVSASEGAGWDAYARPSGAVVRGKWDDGAGHVYVADNDGRLASTADGGSGWIVTGVYDGGVLQRYWYDAGSHAMLTGFFTRDSNRYYGIPGVGYVARGFVSTPEGIIYATNDGVIVQYGSDYLNGIDISHWESDINLDAIQAAFVITKATEGTSFVDNCLTAFANKTLSMGRLLGLYHFADGGSSVADAYAEADHYVDTISSYVGKAMLILDWENRDDASPIVSKVWYAKAFLDRVYERTHVRPLIYMSRSVCEEYDWSSVSQNYGLWVARYFNRNQNQGYVSGLTNSDFTTGAWSSYAMYQYSDSGSLNGYSGDLDLDAFFGTEELWRYYEQTS